jgi:SAM-dependent methyltransferase
MSGRVIEALMRRVERVRDHLRLPADVVEAEVARNGAEPWHVWGLRQHHQHLEALAAMRWIRTHISKDKAILETGCGAGANLLWLAQRGYRKLQGCDVSAEAVATAVALAQATGNVIDVWRDDALRPDRLPNWDVMIAIDWTYLRGVPFALTPFLERYRAQANGGAHVLIDIVDQSFDAVENNQFCTDDWTLPLDARRPTQYEHRLSREAVTEQAAAAGFSVVNVLPGSRIPPRSVYVLQCR